MRLFQAFSLAFNMLTIIPFFKVHNFFKGINGYSAMFYPLVGFFIGGFLWLAYFFLESYVPSTHLSVIIFVLWVTLTGAIHLDGFSDTVDGLFVNSKRALDVMKDSHVGGMGMVFTSLFLLFKLSSLIYIQAYYLLPLILLLSRLNALLAIYFYDYISSGVGKLIKEEFTMLCLIVAIVFALLVAYLFSAFSLFIPSLITLIIIGIFFQKRLGGFNGDIYGFTIEVTELALLNYIIISAAF